MPLSKSCGKRAQRIRRKRGPLAMWKAESCLSTLSRAITDLPGTYVLFF